jgi:hypothetical protein
MPLEYNPPFAEDVVRPMASMIEPRLLPGESLDDVLAGAMFLAEKRAELLGRPVQPYIDLPYVFAAFTWWPFKFEPSPEFEERVHEIRRVIFEGAAGGDTRRLELAVPKTTLLLSLENLNKLQLQGDIEDLLRPPSGA